MQSIEKKVLAMFKTSDFLKIYLGFVLSMFYRIALEGYEGKRGIEPRRLIF